MRNALLMSVLARKQPRPHDLINAIASSTRQYETVLCSEEMPSFTDAPLGNDK